MLLNFLHELQRLPVSARENDPEGPLVEAIEHSFERGGEAEADLGGLDRKLEARIVHHPALLVRVKGDCRRGSRREFPTF